jgi:hypothetical protein
LRLVVRSKECGYTGLGGMAIAITDPAATISQSDRAFIAISSIA